MNIALIGYGKMGKAVEVVARRRGHTIACTVDSPADFDARRDALLDADVAIEFSQPQSAADNLRRCFALHLPVVCGTTGWYDDYDDIADLCRQSNGTLLASTNFSIGMNIMFALNKKLASLMRGHSEYSVDIAETHHIHKLDAPSGTAITLQQQIAASRGDDTQHIPIESFRVGEVPGTHVVRYTSDVDTITLTHEAHSREGLALGAVMAAEFVATRQGIFTMDDIL